MTEPLARSPIAQSSPVVTVNGWRMSARRTGAPLRLCDASPIRKTLVYEPGDIEVPFGRATRGSDGALIVGSGPEEWIVIGGAPGDGIDLTHALVLLRITGAAAAELLGRHCSINLTDRATPDGAAFRTLVAGVVTDVIRDDRRGERSYLLLCDRSYGQYLFDELVRAGGEFGLRIEGFAVVENGEEQR